MLTVNAEWHECLMARCASSMSRSMAPTALLVHDSHAANPEVAFALSRLADPTSLRTTAIGIYRDVQRASYDDLLHDQIANAVEEQGEGDSGSPRTAHCRQRHLDRHA